MKSNDFNTPVRGLMILCSVALVVAMFVPLWQIQLSAPQYPEGLTLLIYTDKLGGNVDIINGLNHYIGMKTLHAGDFIEFRILSYIIGFFAVLALIVFITGKRKILFLFFILFVCFGIIAMADFWRWEYNYGHDLNPDAAIIVPGMAYQPPLIGFKQLLNFGAYSIPSLGGWLFVISGVLSGICVVIIWRNQKSIITKPSASMLLGCIFLFSSCSTAPEPIKTGSDHCYFCKMTISDLRYGAEIVTKKGRIYKFDDSHCLLTYIEKKELPEVDISHIYLTNFSGSHELLSVKDALLLESKGLRAPMGGNVAAFMEEGQRKKTEEQFPGTELNWDQLLKK